MPLDPVVPTSFINSTSVAKRMNVWLVGEETEITQEKRRRERERDGET